jgi:galactokinase
MPALPTMPDAPSPDARRSALANALGAGATPVRFGRAPGRVNLIGDHTDYQGGWCLPLAIDRDVMIAFRPRPDATVDVRSLDLPGGPAAPWTRTVTAVVDVLNEAGRKPVGFDAVVSSTVPIGSGLSSSAAFEVAVAHAAANVAGLAIDRRALVHATREAEHRASGVPCGPMDQLASVFGREGAALLLDCRTLDVRPVPLPAAAAIVVVHSGLPRRLEATAYAERRAATETAAVRLGVRSLRDAHPADVADDPRARHVVTENARVHAFVAALHAGDLAACGQFMLESHASLRDDFDVSTPELDTLVELAVDAGAFGARLTGAGFGGCAVALVPTHVIDTFVPVVTDRYRAATRHEPAAFRVRAAAGAGPAT